MDLVGTLVVRGGRGTVVVHRGESGTALVVDGRPVVVAWSDPTDPDHTWFVRAHDLAELDAAAGQVDLARADVLDALRPLLQHLAEGRYAVRVSDTPDVDRERGRASDAPRMSGRLVDWAGLHAVPADERALIGTIPRDLVDERQVAGLVRAIARGARPAVVAITSGDGDPAYVVAGHTALEAWHRLGQPPLLVRLDVLAPAGLPLALARSLLATACERVGHVVQAHWAAVRLAPSRLAGVG